MVGTVGIVLVLLIAAPAYVDSATGYAEGRAQDPVPQEPAPAPKEQEPAPKKPETNATVDGHVKLRDGRPAAGARIVAKGPEGAVTNATADGNGRFRFTGREGPYSLEIHADGKNRTFEAAIKDGKLTPAEFTVE